MKRICSSKPRATTGGRGPGVLPVMAGRQQFGRPGQRPLGRAGDPARLDAQVRGRRFQEQVPERELDGTQVDAQREYRRPGSELRVHGVARAGDTRRFPGQDVELLALVAQAQPAGDGEQDRQVVAARGTAPVHDDIGAVGHVQQRGGMDADGAAGGLESVVTVTHDRAYFGVHLGDTIIDITMETRGPDHIVELMNELTKAGYEFERVL